MNLRQAAQQALEALTLSIPKPRPADDDYAELGWKEHNAAITALRAALAEPQCMCREPWALERVHREKTPCFDYVERKPLTELEMPTLFVGGLALNSEATTEIVRAVEKAHGIGEQHE